MAEATDFRCAVAARERGDELAGSASTFRSFLLVEHPGPWGSDALLEARLPDGLGAELKGRAGRAVVRVLLIRRGVRVSTDEGIRVYAAHARPGATWLTTTRLRSYHDLLDLDLAALGRGERPAGWRDEVGPLFATCTHGKHDACCAEMGRPVAARLRAEHVPGAWEVSHIGGDRFAGNMLVLPWGLYYGGLDADTAMRVVDAHRADRVEPDFLRGRSSFPMPVQYAEVALRRHLGETRIGAITPRGHERDGDLVTARFEVDGQPHEVVVRQTRSELTQLTCSAARPSSAWRFETVALT